MDPNNNMTPTPEPNPTIPPDPNIANPTAPVPIPPVPEATPSMPSADLPPMSTPEPTPVMDTSANINQVTGMPTVAAEPSNPVFQPGGVGMTDPIMQPEPMSTPDPVQQELDTPMKAAGPVPGSIGSSVSGPEAMQAGGINNDSFSAGGTSTPSVSFTDPATQPEAQNPMINQGAGVPKKNNKMTLIILGVVAGMVVIALAAILILQLTSSNNNQPAPNTNQGTNVNVDDEDEKPTTNTTVVTNTLSCTRNMTSEEIIKYNDAISGTLSISAEFDKDNLLINISSVEDIVYSDEDASNNEPVQMEVHESTAEDLTPTSAKTYQIEADEFGELNLSLNALQTNYESLDFVCELL